MRKNCKRNNQPNNISSKEKSDEMLSFFGEMRKKNMTQRSTNIIKYCFMRLPENTFPGKNLWITLYNALYRILKITFLKMLFLQSFQFSRQNTCNVKSAWIYLYNSRKNSWVFMRRLRWLLKALLIRDVFTTFKIPKYTSSMFSAELRLFLLCISFFSGSLF